MMVFAATAAAACLIALGLTPLAAIVARRIGLLDLPDQNLKRHAQPVPYLGGAAVFVAFAVTLAVVKLWWTGTIIGVVGVLSGSSLITVLGLIDDRHTLSPATKFAGQAVAALVLVACNMRLQFVQPPVLAVALSIFWVVGITNAMNLIDIMDGLSSGVAAIAAAVLFIVAAESGKVNVMLVTAALAGAVLGFLPYNFPRAKIYLGDTGALLLGFVLSAVAMGGGYSRQNPLAVLAPLLILAVPIFDTLFIMFLRQRRGVSMFRGSPDHLALRMVKIGLARQATVLLLWAASAVLGAAAYLSTHLSLQWSLLLYVSTGLAALFVAERMGSVPMDGQP